MAPGASCEAAGGDFLPKHCAAFGRGGAQHSCGSRGHSGSTGWGGRVGDWVGREAGRAGAISCAPATMLGIAVVLTEHGTSSMPKGRWHVSLAFPQQRCAFMHGSVHSRPWLASGMRRQASSALRSWNCMFVSRLTLGWTFSRVLHSLPSAVTPAQLAAAPKAVF
jgi:hypothetical protein